MLSELLREKKEYHRKTVTDSGVGGDVQADVSVVLKSLNSLSRSRYQTCSIRFKVGVGGLSQAQTVITGGYAFYVFLKKLILESAILS